MGCGKSTGRVIFYPEEESWIEAQRILMGEWDVVVGNFQPRKLRIYERYVVWEGLNLPFETSNAAALLHVNEEGETTVSLHINVYFPGEIEEIIELRGSVVDGSIVGGLDGRTQRSHEQQRAVRATFTRQLDEHVSSTPKVDIKIFGSGESDTECLMCFEDFGDGGVEAMVTPCGHVWCRCCIIAVLEVKPPSNEGLCPLCKQNVTFTELRRRASNNNLLAGD